MRKLYRSCNNTLRVLLADLSYKELSGRPKNLWGVHNKMQRKCQKLDSIYDLRAIRVIVRDKTDCYAVLRQVCCSFLAHQPLKPTDMYACGLALLALASQHISSLGLMHDNNGLMHT